MTPFVRLWMSDAFEPWSRQVSVGRRMRHSNECATKQEVIASDEVRVCQAEFDKLIMMMTKEIRLSSERERERERVMQVAWKENAW
jgi:hypothetical protein